MTNNALESGVYIIHLWSGLTLLSYSTLHTPLLSQINCAFFPPFPAHSTMCLSSTIILDIRMCCLRCLKTKCYPSFVQAQRNSYYERVWGKQFQRTRTWDWGVSTFFLREKPSKGSFQKPNYLSDHVICLSIFIFWAIEHLLLISSCPTVW